jgi:hypothetical protein
MRSKPSAVGQGTAMGLVLAVCWAAGLVLAWNVPVLEAHAAQAQAQASTRVFGADAGLIINTIKADRAADFEMVVGKLKEALQKSDKPERKAQAASWRVFKAVEAGPNGSVLYLFWFDPPVKDADYTVAKILAEAFPTEVQALYKTFNECYAGGQSVVNLRLVTAMGQ